MMHKTISILIMFLIVSMSSNYFHDAYACSCARMTEQEYRENSFSSFIGVPIKTESNVGYQNIVTFQIEKPIKNISENTAEITIITSTSSASCGYNFESNTRYLVHTYGDDGQRTFETGLCSGNKNLGFTTIPLLVDESVVIDYSELAGWHQFVLYLLIIGIISGIVIIVVVYKKRKRFMQ